VLNALRRFADVAVNADLGAPLCGLRERFVVQFRGVRIGLKWKGIELLARAI